MKTTRRSFLKYLGGLVVSMAVIPSFLNPKKAEPVQAIASDYLTDDDAWFLIEHDAREFITSQQVFKGDMLYIDADGKVSPKGKMIYGSVKNI